MKRRRAMLIQHSTFNIEHSTFVLNASPLVMGILNITPDSFSDGGVHFDQSKAVHAALQMEEDGAAIIDIGGGATRPRAGAPAAPNQIDRALALLGQKPQPSAGTNSLRTRPT